MNNSIKEIKQPLRAALYARVSTEKQEDEKTIQSQIDEVKKKIAEDGNILSEENIFIDDGWSGMMIARPSLDLMRDAAKEGRFSVLYVYDLGRLSRDFTNQLILLRELEDMGIKFISLRDINPTNPMEGFMQKIMGVFHDYDRVNTIEKFRRGKLFKARNGVIINGTPLYGYRYIRNDPKEAVTCLINDDEARTISLIWNWFGVDKLSIGQIQKKLYDLGIKPKKEKSDFWTRGPIIRILKCDTYVSGKAYYNKSESVVAKHPIKETKYKRIKKNSRRVRQREDWISFDVPQIVKDYSLYEKIQKQLDFNQKYSKKRRIYDYLLSGLIYCGCGNRRSGDGCSKNGHYYYRCIDRIRSYPYESKCTSSGVNAAILDFMVWQELKKRLLSYSLLKKYAEKWLKSFSVMSSEDVLEKQRLNEMIKKVEEEESRYSKAYGSATLEFGQYEDLMKDAKKRKLSYRKQLADLSEKKAEINIEISADELVKEVQEIIKKIDFSNKFKVIRDIIDKVTVTERSGAEICAHLPLPVTITEKLGYEPIGGNSWVTKCR
jgi:site-specific DNA recombinase